MSTGKYVITRVKYWDNTNQEVVTRKLTTRTDDVEAYKASFKKRMKPIQIGFINVDYKEALTSKGGRQYVVNPTVVYNFHALNPDLTLKDLAVKFGVSVGTVSKYLTEVFANRANNRQ